MGRINLPCPDRDYMKNKTKQTPLHKVSAVGRNDVLTSLLEAGGDPNVKDMNGNSPLHCAATFNNPNCVRTLVAHGARVDEPNNVGDTPLLTAASVSSHATVRTLLDAGADIDITNNQSESSVLLAVARENKLEKQEILDTLIDDEADVNQQDDKGYTPLILATSLQDKQSIQRLLKVDEIDVDAATEDGFTALTLSTIHNDTETAEQLLQKGADAEMTTLDEKTAAHYATSIPMVDTLVQNGANINAKDIHGQTPLFTYVQNELSDIAVHGIEIGAEIGILDHAGNTILHEAAMRGDDKVIKAVIEKSDAPGALPSNFDSKSFLNHSNHDGRNVMHQVCSNNVPGTVDAFHTLLENGASLSQPDNNGNLPVHFAARTNNPNLSICLEKDPSSVNIQNKDLNTPLHLAADAEHREAVDRIVNMENVNFELKNDRGMVASEATGNPEISQTIALRRMTQQYKAKDGEIVFGLKWFDWNDLDIHLVCACGEEICFSNRKCAHCELDIDMNVDGKNRITNNANSEQPVEHITFESFPPDGTYQVIVNLFNVFDESVGECEYSVFMVQKDPVTRELSELVLFVKSSFDELVMGRDQVVCQFDVQNGKLHSLCVPQGKMFVNKLENISLPLDYQRPDSTNDSLPPTFKKFLPEMRVIPPKEMDDD